jgi:hypothetical protein
MTAWQLSPGGLKEMGGPIRGHAFDNKYGEQ